MSIPEYMSFLPYTPILGIDIDMAKCVGGSFSGAHGAQRLGGVGGLCDASDANLNATFRILFDAVKTAPHSILIIRSENNNGINEDDILTLVDNLDVATPIGRSHREFLFPMTKGSMPTHGEIIASGKRVLIFLEKDEHATIKPNYETGLYPKGLVMTQKCFMARTLWNRANELMNPAILIESSLVIEDFKHLPPSNFFVMIDYYTTVLGAKYDELVSLHTNLFQKIDSIFARICEYVGRGPSGAARLAAAGGAGGPAPPAPPAPLVPKTCPSAYMFMVDFITPEIISICVDQNMMKVLGHRGLYNRMKTLTRNRAIHATPKSSPLLNRAVAVFRATTPAQHQNVVVGKSSEELNAIQKGWKLLPRPLPPAELINNSSLAVRDPPEIKNAEEYLKNASILPAFKTPIQRLITEYHASHDASEKSRVLDILTARLASSRPSPSKRRLRRRTRKARRFTS
jgi:hypothetical protein